MTDAAEGADTMAGYRNAGERAIRIDMLERLADMLRAEDSRGGFEAKADMLSITGMTLEQFAALMTGLGYKAEKGEREKVKSVAAEKSDTPEAEVKEEAPSAEAETAPEAPATETPEASEAAPDTSEAEQSADAPAEDAPEVEVFYTFTWGRAPAANRGRPAQGGKPRGKGGQGGKPKGKGKSPRRDGDKGQNFSARPPRKEKAIDPDNPFAAALMGLKDNK